MAYRLIRTTTRLPLWGRIVVLYGLTGLVAAATIFLMPAGPVVRYDEPLPADLLAQVAQVQAEPEAAQTLDVNRLSIPRLGVDLAVRDGYYDPTTKEWTLSDTEAFFATVSDRPTNGPSNTFIYGHNRPLAFAPLANLGVDDVVELSDDTGTIFRYVYVRDARIAPTVTNILYEKSETPQLVLMTCNGLFNEVRRVMYFTLVEVA